MPITSATAYTRFGPELVRFWHCPVDLYAAALALPNADLRRLVGARLSDNDGKVERFAAVPLLKTRDCLTMWRRFVLTSPVNTSWGRFDFDDSPALDRAIAVVEEAIADLEERRVVLAEAA